MTMMQRWCAKVALPHEANGCWEWTGSHTSSGYGKIYVGSAGRRNILMVAHRYGYERFVGEIAEGLDLDHLCRNRGCVNPEHLEPVTRSENLRRGQGVGKAQSYKTACHKGHPFDEQNTLNTSDGKRVCRECGKLRMRGYRAAKAG